MDKMDTIDKEKALKQIAEIQKVISGSSNIFFSSKTLFYIGIIILCIPIIEWATSNFTFGLDYGKYSPLIITLIHIIFYWGLSELIARWTKNKNEGNSTPHPLIENAFKITRPIFVAILGSMVAFIVQNNGEFSFPVVYLLLGILFNLYGRFSNQNIVYISWSYIVLGIFYIYLTQFEIPGLAWYFTTYLGLSFITISKFINKQDAQ